MSAPLRFVALVAFATMAGCASGAPEIATQNRTFYAFDSYTNDFLIDLEAPYPPLDRAPSASSQELHGVTVLEGRARLARPIDWRLRGGSNAPGKHFVQYLSPRELTVSLYEWPELPDTPWPDVIARYENDVKTSKGEIVEGRIPVATWGTQGRAYVVRRKIPASPPYVSLTREILLRGENGLVLVQIVHQGATLEAYDAELRPMLASLRLP